MKKYKYIQIGIASPEEIITWANLSLQGKNFKYNPERNDKIYYYENDKQIEYTLKGEVKKHETINYRTLKPERDGLFCEVIFGPTKDYQCACGKSRKTIGDNKTCDKCHVEITESKVRRERMGYIALAAPVVHTWYLRNTPSKIAVLLDMKTRDVEDIVYLASYIITETEEDIEEIQVGRILTEQEHSVYKRRYPFKYQAKTGAEAIKYLLRNLNLDEMVQQIREELKGATKQKREKLIKRLDITESFAKSGNKPEWMVMDVIPVIPPDLRPMVQLDGGRFATTDLNDLYRRIINRNNRLKKQFEQRAPDLIVKNEKRMLQEAVDALIDNSKRNKKAVLDKNRPLKSLSDLLRGKQGRFRQNLLGKRVDYSGRSVIVVGPDLKMYQCGIPREMALILFKPFIINYLRKKELITNPEAKDKAGIRKAKDLIDRGAPQAMEALEKIVVEHPVLLNRAPTLHRLSIQAFEPKLVEGKAIRLHPLVTTAFNADFDGDQMPVHVPLSEEAQAEARLLMLASKNILAPKDGKPVVTPSQDMILGNYYLTIERSQPEKEGRIYKDPAEVEMAYENGEIDLQTRLLIPAYTIGRPFVNLVEDADDYQERLQLDKQLKRAYLMTTYGKIIFNRVFPKTFPYVNEPDVNNLTYGTSERFFLKTINLNTVDWVNKLPLNQPFNKRFLSSIISEIFKQSKLAETSKALDEMKDLGFKYSTIAGITISAFDIEVLGSKEDIYNKAYQDVQKYDKYFRQGLINAKERKRNVVQVWTKAKAEIEVNIKKIMKEKATTNDIFMMADSGARGSSSNFTQLAGMRGLMAKPNGEPMEIPIKSSFREGMTMSEFFISTHGARKGSTDTALKTAESGYLTRRLVDVSQDITITCEDCGTDKGVYVTDVNDLDKTLIESLKDRIVGRFTSKPIYLKDGKDILVNKNQFITESMAQRIISRLEEKNLEATQIINDIENDTLEVFEKVTQKIKDRLEKFSTKDSFDKIKKQINDSIDSFSKGNKEIKEIREKELAKAKAKTDIEKSKEAIEEFFKKTMDHIKEKVNYEFNTLDNHNQDETVKEYSQIKAEIEKVILNEKDELVNEIIDEKADLEKRIKMVQIRSPLTCDAPNGICVKCYGADLSTNEIVEKGEVVGIVAAQSIGEPGTQLTMRTFHSGGVAGEDITQGLPRIQELFEAREPKSKEIISEIRGVVTSIKQMADNRQEISIKGLVEDNDKTYLTDSGKRAKVKEGRLVKPGDMITGDKHIIHPKELLRVASVDNVHQYLLKEVQRVYRSQGVEISDKHIEIIIAQMLQKALVINEGDTSLLPGTFVSKQEALIILTEMLKNYKDASQKNKRLPIIKPILLGITRASLKADSFLSAASFQETTRVLTEAAIRGKIDTLEGLKENIIIGGLIPAGTGLVDKEIIKIEPADESISYSIEKKI